MVAAPQQILEDPMTTTVLSHAEPCRQPAHARFARPGMTRPLAAMLLAAAVAALAVVAERWVDRWTDGHLLAAWLVVWAVVSVAILLIAGTARRIALRTLSGLAHWAYERQQARTRARLLELVGGDERLLADISLVADRTAASTVEGEADVAHSVEIEERISASVLRRRRALALM